jgi:uncharacterized iron-regulated membrane protein
MPTPLSAAEISILFGLGWLGTILVVLVGIIMLMLGIGALHLWHRKKPRNSSL